MDTVLIVLGVIGFGAIVVSAYVFTVAARHYVSDEHNGMHNVPGSPFGKLLTRRSTNDRRSGKRVTFPLMVDGVEIPQDRRQRDRRLDMA